MSAAQRGERRKAGEKRSRKEVPGRQPRVCVIDRNCLEDLRWWVRQQPRVAVKALDLIEQVLRDPFSGQGKPEALKGLGPAHSRRITGEHRLVYAVFDDRVVFLQARYHY